jgi:hypothetical protein
MRWDNWLRFVENLTLHKNVRWEIEDYIEGVADEREVTPTLGDAEAVSSRWKVPDTYGLGFEGPNQHAVLLDLDVPAYLVKSSREGHHHLYVETAAPWEDYVEFLKAAAKIGMLEQGYVNACIERGATSLRLPWVKKGEEREAVANGGQLPPKLTPESRGDF